MESFVRIRVSDGVEALPIDLVAEPVASIEPALNALRGRWASRDLVDVQAWVLDNLPAASVPAHLLEFRAELVARLLAR